MYKKITFQLPKDIRIYFLHVFDPQQNIVIGTGTAIDRV